MPWHPVELEKAQPRRACFVVWVNGDGGELEWMYARPSFEEAVRAAEGDGGFGVPYQVVCFEERP